MVTILGSSLATLMHPMSTAVMQPVTAGCRELKVVLNLSLKNDFSKAEIN